MRETKQWQTTENAKHILLTHEQRRWSKMEIVIFCQEVNYTNFDFTSVFILIATMWTSQPFLKLINNYCMKPLIYLIQNENDSMKMKNLGEEEIKN